MVIGYRASRCPKSLTGKTTSRWEKSSKLIRDALYRKAF